MKVVATIGSVGSFPSTPGALSARLQVSNLCNLNACFDWDRVITEPLVPDCFVLDQFVEQHVRVHVNGHSL